MAFASAGYYDFYKRQTIQELIDILDCIECYEQLGHRLRISKVTQKQKVLYK